MVNEEYILVLRQKGNYLSVEQQPISHNTYALNLLDAARNNPNKTVFDLQNLFYQEFKAERDYYGYLHPYSYSSSYISGASKPKWISYQEYCTELDKFPNKEYGVVFLRNMYADSCCRFIKQHALNQAFNIAENDTSVKMFSKEAIGWNNFTYNITEDIKVCIYTNLGYGYASYFTLTISYKDIVIAPFSHIAKYYKANMQEIIKCTRDYFVSHDSWLPAFDFVADFANQSLNNPEEFVKKHLMGEITEMMEGLRTIMSHPQEVLRKFCDENAIDTNYKRIFYISPMEDLDKELFHLYESEMPVVFKGEKIANALHTLESLKKIAEVYSPVLDYIEEVLDMNCSLIPELKKTKDNVDKDIEILKCTINEHQEALTDLDKRYDEKYDEYLALVKELKSNEDKTKDQIHEEQNKLWEDFKNTPEVADLLAKSQSERDFIEQKRKILSGRQTISSRLQNSIEQGMKHIKESA